jgi:hypothetical protein
MDECEQLIALLVILELASSSALFLGFCPLPTTGFRCGNWAG